MSILVIGGMGSIGSFVTRRLIELGLDAVVYARHKNLLYLSDIADKVVYAEGDIMNVDHLIKTIKEYKVERIIHMAALLSSGTEPNPPLAVRLNVEGTANILDAAVKCGIKRVVYSSAKGAYSEAVGEYAHPTYKPLPEDYPTEDCMGFYGLTKLFGEKIGYKYRQKYGLEFIAIRYGATWGPGKLLHGATPHTAHVGIIENAMLGKPFVYPQGGDQKEDMIYHKDSANGVVLACMTEGLTHPVFNIGTGVGTTMTDFAAAVKTLYPAAEIKIGPGLDFLMKGYGTYCVYDISRAKRELGYEPRYDVEKGVADYVRMMRLLKIQPTYTPPRES